MTPDVKPVFQKDGPVSYSLVSQVEKEYDKLVEADILYPVSHSSWASPVVHVPKADGSIRVCGDYKSVPLLFWPWATEPWQRVHVDFAEAKGQQFLIIVDSHSKWLEVFSLTTTTATAIINVLRTVFARYGLPHEVVSDNGPQFVSEEYQTFLKMNRVKCTLVSPYHPASTGFAERHADIQRYA